MYTSSVKSTYKYINNKTTGVVKTNTPAKLNTIHV